MANFYMTARNGINQNKTMRGHKTSGLIIDVDGWDKGIRVIAKYDKELEKDVFEIYQTSGSNNTKPDKLIKTIK